MISLLFLFSVMKQCLSCLFPTSLMETDVKSLTCDPATSPYLPNRVLITLSYHLTYYLT
jgi:hypothetical protein